MILKKEMVQSVSSFHESTKHWKTSARQAQASAVESVKSQKSLGGRSGRGLWVYSVLSGLYSLKVREIKQ